MEEIAAALPTIAHRISRIVANLKKKGIASITEAAVKNRLQMLEDQWKAYAAGDRSLRDAAVKDIRVRAFPHIVEDHYDAVEESYLEQADELQALLTSLTREALTADDSNAARITTRVAEGRKRAVLPKIPLPTFTGRYNEWLAFQDTFTTLIMKDNALDNVEKLHYLKSCLQGEAASLLRNVQTTAQNFERAWDTLKRRYENRQVLVREQLAALWEMPAVTKESSADLKKLVYETSEAVEALEGLGRPISRSEDWIVYLTVEKLDRQTHREWENAMREAEDLPNFAELRSFLEKRIVTVEALERRRGVDPVNKQKAAIMEVKSAKIHQVSKPGVSAKSAKACPICRGSHYVLYCDQYQKKSAGERMAAVRSLRLCFNCLGKHTLAECTNAGRCQVCADNHHSSLHEAYQLSKETTVHHAALRCPRVMSVLLSTARVRVSGPGCRPETVRALIDSGSEVSLISESLVQRLGLRRQHARIPLLGVGGAKLRVTRGRSDLIVASCYDIQKEHKIEALILAELSCYRPRDVPEAGQWPHLEEIPLADPRYRETDPVDLLLGADVYHRILRCGVIPGGPDRPAAQETDFGWILNGAVTAANQDAPLLTHHCSVDRELVSALSRFWEQEEVTTTVPLSSEDQACEDHFAATHRRARDGRFVVRLPFREAPQLGDSRGKALQVLRSMQRRFQRNESLRNAYRHFMQEYEQLGHMQRTKLTTSEPVCFLPHHGVIKESSTTTKLRVVFNGSMTTSSGKSLNDYLYTGQNLLPPLFDVLLRWRRHAVAFTADVEKMFRQILIHPEDRRWQQILWSCNEGGAIITYQLNTLTYGMVCAPYLATRCIKQLASDEALHLPAASTVLMRDIYMDDVLTGASTVEGARRLQQDLNELLTAGGFILRKWACNIHDLVDGIEGPGSPITLEAESSHGVLGLKWLPSVDCFQVTVAASPHLATTRRSVLSRTAQLFDPMGWLAPVTVAAKIRIQALWLLKADWDSPLPAREEAQWRRFMEALPELDGVRIPRWLGVAERTTAVELHGFADASQLAYAAVVYVRTVNAEGEGRVILGAAKTKVAPLKKVTLPRLELSAACLLARLTHHMTKVLEWDDIKVHLWTDSLVTLSWIRGHPSQWRTYVANRVAEIQGLLPQARWHYVKGVENPADCASRGLAPEELRDFSLWWTGPRWLAPDGSWPSADPGLEEGTQEERVRSHHIQKTPTSEITAYCLRFSKFQRLCRVTAWCCRWLRSSIGRGSPHLTAEEVLTARTRLVRAVQLAAFPSEISCLRQKRRLPAKSRLIKFAPFLDGPGVLRLGGRLQRAALPYERTHPLILPDEAPMALLWAEDVHRRTLHGGVQLTLATLRQECWILRGRAVVKGCINRCHRCVRWRGRTLEQLMGSLPPARVTPTRPFLKTGVDYAGPILVRTGRGRGKGCEKGYIALFVCLATRAVHLELVSDGSTTTFLAALTRFTSRRGVCAELYSDCGTVFVGADRELRDLVCTADTNNRDIFDAITAKGIEWKFNPPSAPHFGGIWEAAVKSVKHHLRRQIGEQRLTFEELTTLLAGIEACLNSRPLQPLTDDPDDLEALTPGHFLVGGPITALPEAVLDELPVNRLSRWQLVQQLQQHFWRRWSKEYLNTLQTRGKWHEPRVTVEVGALCLIKSELLPPNRWPLARVVEIHAGPDGLVRVVTLKTTSSRLQRPINKVVVLPNQQTAR